MFTPTSYMRKALREGSLARCRFVAADVEWSRGDEALVIYVKDGPRKAWQEQKVLRDVDGEPRQMTWSDIDDVLGRFDSSNVENPWKRVQAQREHEAKKWREEEKPELLRDLFETTRRWFFNRSFSITPKRASA